MRKGYAIFLFGCVLFEEVVSCMQEVVSLGEVLPLAGNRYKVATTHAQRALLLREREDDGEGFEGSHELFFQFGNLSFVEG